MRGVNTPAGGSTSSASPAFTRSHSQFDARPSRTRLTVIFGAASMPGALDSE